MRRYKRLVAWLTSLTMAFSLAAPALAANPASGITSTGQTLGIEITGPADGSRVNVPPGALTATGTVSIGPLSNSGNVMYVIDVSGSTLTPTNQDCNGDHAVNAADDVNGDGTRGSTLDCEIAGVVALNNSLAGAPGASGGIIVFGNAAASADADPTAGQQNFTSPLNADKNSSGTADLEQVARSVRVGSVGLFASRSVGTTTNYNATLTELANAFAGKAGQHNLAFFLSDGLPSPGTFTTGAGTPLAAVVAAGISVNTYSVGGAGAGCGASSALRQIANATGGTCTAVSDPSQLTSVLVQPAAISRVDVSLNGGAQVEATLSGNSWSLPLSGLQPGIWNTIAATVTASDGSTTTADVRVYGNQAPAADAGSAYVVDEGSSIALGGLASDPDGDATTVTWAPSTHLTGAHTATPIFTADDNLTEALTMTVSDPYGLSATSSSTVEVRNVPPTATLVNNGPVGEGSGVGISMAGAHDPSPVDTAAGFHYAFDCTGGDLSAATYAGSGADNSTVCTFDDGPSTHVVKARIIDKDGGWGEYATTVSVENVAPTAIFSSPVSVDEGSPVTAGFSGQFDPSAADTTAGFHYTFACDGGSLGAADYASAGLGAATTCTFDDGPGTHVVTGRILDKDGGYSEYSTTVTVKNVAPTATLTAPAAVNEGSSFALALTAPQDPSEADTAAGFTYSYDCGGGAGYQSGTACVAIDNPAQTVKARILDKDGGYSVYTAVVTVANVAPTVSAIAAPADPQSVGTSVAATATFTDPGVLDTHTALWNWGDGTTSAGVVTESSGNGQAAGSHTYSIPGVYTVTLTVTDKDGGVGVSTLQNVVVYDPDGAFVTGGGWINSPAGAYAPNPALTGRANFGFVAKYHRGANVPTGQTEFQLKAGDLNFHSTSYDWLVVAGSRATYKGSGTINGAGNYGFMLTAVDGKVSGGGGVDKLRLKIWDKATGGVVYDNLMGAADDATPTTALAGGSIVIHN